MRDCVARWRGSVFDEPVTRVLADAAWLEGVRAPLFDHTVLQRAQALHSFSHTLLPVMDALDQEWTGQCWAFAGLSLLRRKLACVLSLPADFALSSTYLVFYDKLERAHAFLRYICDTRPLADDDRYVHHLLASPITDGNCWHNFASLVRRYGVVPATSFPASRSSIDTHQMNSLLRILLRDRAHALRTEKPKAHPQLIEDALRAVYRLLCICMGAPPALDASFEWWYTPRDENAAVKWVGTPLDLYKKCGVSLEKMVTLTHIPSLPLNASYTVELLDTVVDDESTNVFYNVSLDCMRQSARDALRANTGVWIACEFDAMRLRQEGLLHHNLVHVKRAIGMSMPDRAARIASRAVNVDHAVLLTGHHEEADGSVTRWRVENSHGTTDTEGYLSMSDEWFRNHVFAVVVENPEVAAAACTPQAIPPWHILGIVACGK